MEEQNTAVIERHVTFHVLPGHESDFKQFFKQEYRPAMETTKGFIKADLIKDTENPSDLMMVLRFDSVDSAATWRASEIHAALKPKLKSLYDGSDLRVYQVLE